MLSTGSPFRESMESRHIAANLRALRSAYRLTQSELAHQLGLAKQGYISNLESGRKAPSLELIVRVADLFGVSVDDLLSPEQPVVTPRVRERSPVLTPSQPPKLLGAKVRHLRLKHKFSQAEVAQRLGLAGQAFISHIETGRRDPSLDVTIRIAVIFTASMDYLLRDTVPVEAVDEQQ